MTKTKKRLVFCFDGTWNRLSAKNPTNVVKLAQMVKPVAFNGTPQIVYYDEGIGTDKTWLRRVIDGAFGWGMVPIMREAYRFLIFNYEPGDEIFVFGFSRGAYTARSFVGFVRHAGILDAVNAQLINEAIEIYREAKAGTGREEPRAQAFRIRNCPRICVSEEDYATRRDRVPGFDLQTPLLEIRYVGVWDTVRALGVPEVVPGSGWFNHRYAFHDAVLTSKVQSARHAIALDERRLTFLPTPFGRDRISDLNAAAAMRHGAAFDPWALPYQEKWFPGVHGAVGGGGLRRGLSDCALQWVLNGALRAGLDIRNDLAAVAFDIRPDALENVYNDDPGLWKKLQALVHNLLRVARAGPSFADEIALSTYQRWTDTRQAGKTPYNPRSLRRSRELLDNWPYRLAPEVKRMEGVEWEEHTITSADSLSILARRYLRDPMRWPELFALNRDRIDDPDYLANGLKLRIRPKGGGTEPAGR